MSNSFEFYIDSDVPKEDVMAENEIVLKQRDSLGVDVHIKLIDGRELQVSKKGKKTQQAYSIDILSLQDKSEKLYSIAWKWLFSSITVFIVMLILLKVLPLYLEADRNLYLGITLFIGIVGTLFCFTQFWKHTSRKQVFHSRNGHIPVIEIRAGKPSKKIFSNFIDVVEKRIKKFRHHMKVPEDKQLTGEMKMLRRLCNDGVISKTDYEKAKTKLFSGFDSNFINRESEFK